MKKLKVTLICASIFVCACSTPPPPPPKAEGEILPANDQASMQELVRAAVAAANPKTQRFVATRGEKLKDVLIRWTAQERTRLLYQTDFDPILNGAISEPDLKAAGVSLSVLLQHESSGAILDFRNPKAMVVTGKSKNTQPCTQVPAGAIVVGQFCTSPAQEWFVDPSDRFLSTTLMRWATAAKLDLKWQSKLDWPITLTARKQYVGDLQTAIATVAGDLASSGVEFRYAITNMALVIEALPRTQSPASSQSKESKK